MIITSAYSHAALWAAAIMYGKNKYVVDFTFFECVYSNATKNDFLNKRAQNITMYIKKIVTHYCSVISIITLDVWSIWRLKLRININAVCPLHILFQGPEVIQVLISRDGVKFTDQ